MHNYLGGLLSHGSRRRQGWVPPSRVLAVPCDSLPLSVPACFLGEQGISILPGTGGHCAELDEPGAYYWVSCDYGADGLTNELFFGADLLGKGAGEEADSLSPFDWEVSAIR